MPNIQTFENQDEIDEFLIKLFTDISHSEIKKKNSFSIALSGGTTPLSFYEKLSKKKDILWDKIHIFFVDERMVPDSSSTSNIYQINKVLINSLRLKNVHYINKEIEEKDAALEYALDIKSFFKDEKPSFDFILLGIGKDGHTASIFPDTDAMKEREKIIVLTQKKEDNFLRMSFSLSLINHAKNIVFIASGHSKVDVIKKIFLDKDSSLPVVHVKSNKNIYFCLDRKSAKFLDL